MGLLDNGAIALASLLIADGGVTAFNNANARLCVGDSSTAFNKTQTDLQAATNKLRKAMDASYPSRSSNVLTFRSTFNTTDANFAWNEWGVADSASGNYMFNRVVASLGTKAAGSTWVFTATVTITA